MFYIFLELCYVLLVYNWEKYVSPEEDAFKCEAILDEIL